MALIFIAIASFLVGVVAGGSSSRIQSVITTMLSPLKKWWVKRKVVHKLSCVADALFLWQDTGGSVLYLVAKEHTDEIYELLTEVQNQGDLGSLEVVVRAHQGRKYSNVVPPGSERIY